MQVKTNKYWIRQYWARTTPYSGGRKSWTNHHHRPTHANQAIMLQQNQKTSLLRLTCGSSTRKLATLVFSALQKKDRPHLRIRCPVVHHSFKLNFSLNKNQTRSDLCLFLSTPRAQDGITWHPAVALANSPKMGTSLTSSHPNKAREPAGTRNGHIDTTKERTIKKIRERHRPENAVGGCGRGAALGLLGGRGGGGLDVAALHLDAAQALPVAPQ